MRPRVISFASALLLAWAAGSGAQTCPADPLATAGDVGATGAMRLPFDPINLISIDGVQDAEIDFTDFTAPSGNTLRARRIDTLEPVAAAVLLGNVANMSPLTKLDNGTEIEFVVRADGVVSQVSLPAVAQAWASSPRRGVCRSDSLGAAPVTHLRRRATPAFQDAYFEDVVYVGTRFTACAGSTTQNDSGGLYVGGDNGRVYQLDPATGAVLDSRRSTTTAPPASGTSVSCPARAVSPRR